MASIRGVILDVDGTLVDSNDEHARAWANALHEFGYDIFCFGDFLFNKGNMAFDEFRKCGLYPFRAFNFISLPKDRTRPASLDESF